MFESNQADFHRLLEPLLIFDKYDSMIKIGSIQLTYDIGFMNHAFNTTESDIDLLDTVKPDKFSAAFFFTVPVIIYMINYAHIKFAIKHHISKKTDSGSIVMIKLNRVFLNQTTLQMI